MGDFDRGLREMNESNDSKVITAAELLNSKKEVENSNVGVKIVYKHSNGMIGTWTTCLYKTLEETIQKHIMEFDKKSKIESISLYFTIEGKFQEYNIDLSTVKGI